jgi:hypothetical protein
MQEKELSQRLQQLEKRLQCRMLATNISGAYTPDAPKEDLDLKTASDKILGRYGIPWHRPTAKDSRAYFKAWEKAAARKYLARDRIIPHFEPKPGLTHNLKKPLKKLANQSFTGTQWAGAGFLNGPGWGYVQGTWTIPTVSRPTEAQGNGGGWDSSSWVGLDGWFDSNDVLQAGIQQAVDASGNTTYIPWFEWWVANAPAGAPYFVNQTNISNFSAVPGQVVSCFVSYIWDNTWGHIVFTNQTSNSYIAIWLVPPPGASFDGQSAEWIMEAPNGGTPATELPKFTPVVFTDAFACGGVAEGDPQFGDTTNIEDGAGTVVTSVTTGPDTVTVDFTG